MSYATTIPGLGETLVTLVPPGLMSSARLTTPAGPALKGKTRGSWILRGEGDKWIEVKLKVVLWDPLPTIVLADGQQIRFAPPLKTGQTVLMLLPMVLVIVGGAIGGGLGALGSLVNGRILRSTWPPITRIVACVGVTVATIVSYILLVGILWAVRH